MIRAIGTMSGTSLDGVDAALLRSDGEEIAGFGKTAFGPYSVQDQQVLRDALGQWEGPKVEAAKRAVERCHIDLLQDLPQGEVIGFHGQTLAHDPLGLTGPPRTFQVGDGRILAEALQRPVIWDFRSADVKLGGQGAPLAPFFHFACAKWIGATAPLAVLNLGGVGNISYVDPRKPTPETPGALLAFDTGPANAPLNDLMQARLGVGFDEDGGLAATGTPNAQTVAQFLKDPYFAKIPPKSLDRNSFSTLIQQMSSLSDADAAATLLACAAGAVARGLAHLPSMPERILVCGGGRKNPVFMRYLSELLEPTVQNIDEVGLDGDMLEAQAFAFLAIRVLRGLPTSCPTTTGVRACIGGGIVSRP